MVTWKCKHSLSGPELTSGVFLLWWVYYSSPKRVTDLFGRVCICCGGCTIVVL